MSNVSGSGYMRSSRPAAPVTRTTFDPRGMVTSCRVTSRVVKRALTGDGGSYRRISSTAFATSEGSAASSARWSGCAVEQVDRPPEVAGDGLGAGR